MNVKTIRSEIVTKLTGNTPAGNNVRNAPAIPGLLDSLPLLSVYTSSVAAENIDHTSPTFTKDIEVEITGIVGTYGTYADDLDDMMEAVKQTLFTDPTWFSQYLGDNPSQYTEEYVIHTEGETHYATCTLTFTVRTFEEWA